MAANLDSSLLANKDLGMVCPPESIEGHKELIEHKMALRKKTEGQLGIGDYRKCS